MQQAIAELGYRPNLAARALVTGSTRTIGLVTVKINQYGPAQTMLGLEKAARAAGYSLSVSILDDATAEAMREAVDRFVAQSVDAVVALSTYDDAAEALHSIDAPVPLVAVQVGGGEDRPAVGVDQETGARLATRHLLDLGHRTVHHVAGPGGLAGGARPHRRAGAPSWRRPVRRCRSSCAGTGRRRRATPPAGSWPPGSGRARTSPRCSWPTTRWPSGCSPPCTRRGWRCPDDVSVVGFDDLPEAPYFTPPLTTVRQDFAELGRRGVQLVLARLAGRGPAPRAGARAAARPGEHRPARGRCGA